MRKPLLEILEKGKNGDVAGLFYKLHADAAGHGGTQHLYLSSGCGRMQMKGLLFSVALERAVLFYPDKDFFQTVPKADRIGAVIYFLRGGENGGKGL